MSYAILVIDKEGNEEYVCDGLGDRPSCFLTKRLAEEQAEFLGMGIADEVQSINVVQYPRLHARRGA